MKKKIYCLVLLLGFLYCNSFSQVGLLKLSSNTFTPNTTDTIGAFARIYYHSARKKFYLLYAARYYAQTNPSGVLNNYRWMELDTSLVATGSQGILPSLTGAGDFAMVMVDSNYYHLSVGGGGAGDYKLTKFDDDFNKISSVIIDLDPCESNIDQEMNYTNGKLVIGAMYDATICPPINPPSTSLKPYTRIYQYDTNLVSVATPKLLDTSKITWGASIIYRNGYYYEITMDNFTNRDLYVHKYDSNFNYISRTLLNADGQWSQGLLWDGRYYYVAHHTLDHNHGNVLLSVYDSSWNIITTKSVTTYPAPVDFGPPMSSLNANRPYIIMVGSKIYISYDVESYIMNANQKDWQAHVDVYQINYALPVVFTTCGLAVKQNNKVEINWQTNNEINVKEFLIQKSIDGSRFMNVGRVPAVNNNNANSYTFLDEVNNFGTDKVFYRIINIDNDATKTYSKTMVAQLKKNESDVSIYPNPAKDKIYFNSNTPLNGESVEIIEMSGRVISTKQIENNTVSLPTLANGVYFVRMNTVGKSFVQKLVVQ